MKKHALGDFSSRRFAILMALGLAVVISRVPSSKAAIVASNVPDGFAYSGFRLDVGYASSTNGGFANTAFAQPFIPNSSGQLSQLLVYMSERNGSLPLKVSIRRDSGGKPGSSLGETTISAAAIPSSYFPPESPTLLNLSSLNLFLNAGQKYHVVFRTDSALSGSWYYSSHILNPHAKSFGMPYVHSRDGGITWPETGAFYGLEVPIKVFVVPEPALASLIVATSVATVALRRRVKSTHQRYRLSSP